MSFSSTTMTTRKPRFYAVAKGAKTGVFKCWSTVSKHVTGFPGAVYKKFDTEVAAQNFIRAFSLNSLNYDLSFDLDDSCSDSITDTPTSVIPQSTGNLASSSIIRDSVMYTPIQSAANVVTPHICSCVNKLQNSNPNTNIRTQTCDPIPTLMNSNNINEKKTFEQLSVLKNELNQLTGLVSEMFNEISKIKLVQNEQSKSIESKIAATINTPLNNLADKISSLELMLDPSTVTISKRCMSSKNVQTSPTKETNNSQMSKHLSTEANTHAVASSSQPTIPALMSLKVQPSRSFLHYLKSSHANSYQSRVVNHQLNIPPCHKTQDSSHHFPNHYHRQTPFRDYKSFWPETPTYMFRDESYYQNFPLPAQRIHSFYDNPLNRYPAHRPTW